MKLKLNNKYVKWGVTAFLVIAAGISFYYLVFHISDIIKNVGALLNVVMPVVFGFVIAYLLTPILNFIERKALNPFFDLIKVKKNTKRDKWVRAIAIILTSVLFFYSIYALIAMVVSQIVPSIQAIVKNFDIYVTDVTAWLNKLFEDNKDLQDFIIPQFYRLSSELEHWLTDTATLLEKSTEVLKTVSLSVLGILKVLWNFVIGFVISIYVLASKETFAAQGKKIIYAAFEKDSANSVLSSLRFVHKTFIGFFSGKVLDSIIIGLLCFIGTTLLNTPYAALVSLIVGVTNVIPFFGPYLGAIPCAILILIVDLANPMSCITFIIFILFLQQLDGNLIGPMILGDSTGLSGFWVIFSITVFGGLFGVGGMIVGVPVFAVFFAVIRGLVNRSLIKKNMPIQSDIYMNMESVNENGEFIERVEEEQNKPEKKIAQKSLFKEKNRDKTKKSFKFLLKKSKIDDLDDSSTEESHNSDENDC